MVHSARKSSVPVSGSNIGLQSCACGWWLHMSAQGTKHVSVLHIYVYIACVCPTCPLSNGAFMLLNFTKRAWLEYHTCTSESDQQIANHANMLFRKPSIMFGKPHVLIERRIMICFCQLVLIEKAPFVCELVIVARYTCGKNRCIPPSTWDYSTFTCSHNVLRYKVNPSWGI
jgi:hypothetical protein